MSVVVIAAVARNGVIGRDGGIPWHIPEDMARFKELTTGHTLIMGRATFESIGRALPGRRTVVLTGRPGWHHDGVEVASSLEAALDRVVSEDVVFIAGGSAVYEAGLGRADRLELTEVDLEPEGDTWFPEVDWGDWRETQREERDGFSFVTYARA